MKFKVGDKVCYKHPDPHDNVEVGEVGTICGISEVTGHYGVAFETKDTYKHNCGGLCRDNYGWWCDESTLEPADSKILRMADGTVIGEFAKEGIIGEFKGIPIYATGGTVSIHDLPTSEWYNPMRLTFKNGSSIETIPNEDAIRSKEPELVWIDKIALPTATETKEMVERVRREILNFTNAFPKEEKKMPTKFTFYFNVNEGTRVDKSCNGTIPTITTSVVLDKFGDPDRRKCYSLEGEATCDKADYDMRQGVLEALANAVFDGNFEKAYDKAVKTNAFCERQDRTCHYCGKVLDTIEEKQVHEAWHVERKKARRERYLLRKRAKEIAFEEAAQKMAKEMIKEDK